MKPLLAKSLAALVITSTIGAVCLVRATAENPTVSPTPSATTANAPDAQHPHHHHGGWEKEASAMWGHHQMAWGHGGGHEKKDPMLKIVGELDLTETQRKEIGPILKAQEEQIEAIRKQEKSQIEALVSNGKIQILPYLTPQQQQILTDQAKLEADRAALHQDDKH